MKKLYLLFIVFSAISFSMYSQDIRDIPGENLMVQKVDGTQFESMPLPEYRPALKADFVGKDMVGYDLLRKTETKRDYPILDFATFQSIAGREGIESIPRDEEIYTPKNFSSLIRVTNPSAYPWCVNVKLFMTFPDGGRYVASGVLIDSKHVLTAGHCVYNHSGGGWASRITVVPAYNNGAEPYGEAESVNLYSWTGWTQNANYEWDMGVIVLDRPVGAITGWHGYGYNNDDNFFSTDGMDNLGYPAASPYNGQYLYSWAGTFDDVYPHLLYFNRQAYGGQSGSGVYDIQGSNRVVYAELSHGSSTSTGCIRINSDKFNGISGAISTNTPSGFDLIPLFVQADPTTVSPGNSLSSVEFRVHNYSTASFSGNVTAHVYMSTNTTISTGDVLLRTYNYALNLGGKSTARCATGSNPPTIPGVTPSGDYYIGVILSISDNNTGNNVTREFDVDRISVSPPQSPRMEYYSHAIDDDNNVSSGDNDGRVEPRETIEMPVTLINRGNVTATNVSAILATSDPYITITDNDLVWGTIAAGATARATDFDFMVAPGCPEHNVTFTLYISSAEGSWTDQFIVHVYPDIVAPDLEYYRHTIDDDTNISDGNGNGYPEPGEDIEMPISLINTGNGNAHNVRAVLSTSDPYISITDNDMDWSSTIVPGSIMLGDDDFDYDIAPDCPERDVLFNLAITSDEGSWTDQFIVHVYPANGSPNLEYFSHRIDDDNNVSSGNGDGRAEPGENIELPVTLINRGSGDAHDVSVVISTSDPYITLTDNDLDWPNTIPAGTTAEESDFDFEVASNCPERAVSFTLHISSAEGNWVDQFTVHIHRPPNPPVANFSGTPRVIDDITQSVSFTDLSTNGPTAWSWIFDGGSPATSTQRNPVVSYHTPGSFDVTLTVTNIGGSDTEYKGGYITVNPACSPGWSVVTYTNSTTAYGKVTIGDVNTPADAGDMVGAFVGSECRGIGYCTISAGEAFVTVIVQGESVEQVEFKVFDVSVCQTYDNAHRTQTNPGNTIGYPPNYLPICASCQSTQAINFNAGWNLMSLCVHPSDMATASVFGPMTNLVQVKNMTQSYDPALPAHLNTLVTLYDGQGYFVRTSANEALNVVGQLVNGTATVIGLGSGWNLIGYPFISQSATVSAYATLISSGNLVQVKNMSQSFDPALPPHLNTLNNLAEGEGYFIRVNSGVNFIYPAPASWLYEHAETVTESPWNTDYHTQSMVHYAKVTLDGMPLTDGGIVGAFKDNACRAQSRTVDYIGESYVTLVVHGTVEELINFRLYYNGTIYQSTALVINKPGEVTQEVLDIDFDSKTATSIQSATDRFNIKVVPNPVKDLLTISFDLNKPSLVGISVVDVVGKVSFTSRSMKPAGACSMNFYDVKDKYNMKPGVYILRISINGSVMTKKLIVK